MWAMSNYVSCGYLSIKKFLEDDPLVDRVLMLCENTNINIRQEAIYTICNTLQMGKEMAATNLLGPKYFKQLIKIFSKALAKKQGVDSDCAEEVLFTLFFVI